MIHLDTGEEVLRTVRRHWLVFAVQSVTLALFAAAPAVVLVLPGVLSRFDVSIELGPRALFFSALWWLVAWMLFAVAWTNYHLDVWLITTKRIIEVEQRGLFHRETSECRFERVQDVTMEVKGFLATFLRFGNVYIQTAGEAERFGMVMIPDPDSVKNVISSRCAEVMEGPGGTAARID